MIAPYVQKGKENRMKQNSIFVEGLQGAGKTTFVNRLSEKLSDYKVFREGDYSPVELAWCAYVTEQQYQDVLAKYPSLRTEIEEKTLTEGTHKIICYSQILTDIPGFHKDLEGYEIYNGNWDKEPFEQVILNRFQKWEADKQIFECSIFQNIIVNQMLYFMTPEDQIVEFYQMLRDVLSDRPFQIIYLDVEDIPGAVDVIRKERVDEQGNELWFQMMTEYLQNSPCGKAHALEGIEGLIWHLEQRKRLEHRIIEEVFKENSVRLKAKSDSVKEFIKKC